MIPGLDEALRKAREEGVTKALRDIEAAMYRCTFGFMVFLVVAALVIAYR